MLLLPLTKCIGKWQGRSAITLRSSPWATGSCSRDGGWHGDRHDLPGRIDIRRDLCLVDARALFPPTAATPGAHG